MLESIVRKDFLPRGTGLVTRRSLVLKLIQNRENQNEYAYFDHLGEEKVFKDFKEVKAEMKK